MQRFTVQVIKQGFGASAVTLPEDLLLTPQTWSASDRGGCKQCTINASGSAESLAGLCGWLGDRIEIYNEAGDLVWWGVLWDLEVNLGHLVVSLSMDNIFNRVAVTYPFQMADGSQESRTTLWVEDQNSINHYGTRELLYGMPESFTSSASGVRDRLLTRLSSAGAIVSSQPTASMGARLTGQGIWTKASAVYFTNLDGLEEHTDTNGSQVIGRYYVSTGISFADNTPGHEADEIHDSGAGFSPLTAGDVFTLSGATVPANNDTYTIDHMDDVHQIAISGTFEDEAAGASIKISYGEGIAQDIISQGFQLDAAWTVTHVAVQVRKLGNPSDSFRIGIYPNSGGIPGTVLTYNETLGSALFTELTWTEFAFATPVALTGSTTYYIVIRRTGSASLADGYEVALDEDVGYSSGIFRVWNGSSWVSRSPDADMPFRVIGEISSTAQLAKAIDAVPSFGATLVQVDSLIPVRQYTDSPRFALDTIEEMLDAGTSTGERLIAWVTPDSAVVVGIPPESGEENLVLGGNGKVRYPTDSPYPPGRLVYGQYIDIDSTLLLDGLGIRANRGPSVYIESSSYDAASDMLSIQSEGALDPWTALAVRKG